MAHGGHDDVDLEEALNAPMPPPHCAGPWRESVAGLVLVSAVVLGITVHSHYLAPTPHNLLTRAVASSAPTPPAAAGSSEAVVSVAATMPATTPAVGPPPAPDANVRFVASSQRTAFNAAAQRIRPSVVGITASFAPTGQQQGVRRVGSGVVVDGAGFVVTCHHVVTGASSITISRFRQPNVQRRARLLAVRDDLALLQVEGGQPWPAAALGDSERAAVGDWVLAVGHPFGLGLTVTAGIIGRRHGALAIPGGRQYTGLLQTDAPINEGSSGGPLVNLSGEVIGLNTAIYAPTGVFSGAGFAIPSNTIRGFLARHLTSFGAQAAAPLAMGPRG